MRTLVHHNLKQWDELLSQYNQVMAVFNGTYGEYESAYETLLFNCIEIIEKNGTNTELADIRNMQAVFKLSKTGIHPFRLEKVQFGRRDLKYMMAYHGLEKIGNILKARVGQTRKTIDDARLILADLMLSIIQSGTISADLLNSMQDIQVLSTFWTELISGNPQVMLLHKKLKLTLMTEDIHIILYSVVSDLSN